RLPGAQGIAGRGPDASHDRRVGRHSDNGSRPRAAARRACAGQEEPQAGGAERRFATRGPLVTSLMLSGEKLDALQELVNIGMGAAGAALANALGAFVELAVPAVDVTDRQRVATLLENGSWGNNQDVEAVRQRFYGALMGES